MASTHTHRKTSPGEPEPLTKKDIISLKEMLIRKRDEITGQITKLKSDAVDGSDSSNWEEDGTDAFNREFAFKMAGSRNEMLNQVDKALNKIAENTYGICDDCDSTIGRARMTVLPFCGTCINCQAQSEEGRAPKRIRVDR